MSLIVRHLRYEPAISLWAIWSQLVRDNRMSRTDAMRVLGDMPLRGSCLDLSTGPEATPPSPALQAATLQRLVLRPVDGDVLLPRADRAPGAVPVSRRFVRYCRDCLVDDYHSVVMQNPLIERCPAHGALFEAGCWHCKSPVPSSFEAAAASPFRCPRCREALRRHVASRTAAKVGGPGAIYRGLAKQVEWREFQVIPSRPSISNLVHKITGGYARKADYRAYARQVRPGFLQQFDVEAENLGQSFFVPDEHVARDAAFLALQWLLRRASPNVIRSLLSIQRALQFRDVWFPAEEPVCVSSAALYQVLSANGASADHCPVEAFLHASARMNIRRTFRFAPNAVSYPGPPQAQRKFVFLEILGAFAAAVLALRRAGDNELRNLARFSCDLQGLMPIWIEATTADGKPCVRILTRVGGEEAMALLTRYRTVCVGRSLSVAGAAIDPHVTSGH